MKIGVLVLNLYIPGCHSLKEKRSRIKPLVYKMRKEFNVTVAEIDQLDIWQNSTIACAMIGNETSFLQSRLQRIANWMEYTWRDLEIVSNSIEII